MVAHISSPLRSSFRPRFLRSSRAAETQAEALADVDLVRRFNAGDESAFAEIVTRYRTRMFQVSLRYLHSHADAEEIAQDTFIRAHRGLARFRGDCSLASWLYRVTTNLSFNRRARLRRRCHHLSLSLDAAFSDSNPRTFASKAPSAAREMASGEFAEIVRRCRGELADSHREILTLFTSQHHSYDRISELLGINLGTVKSRIARARSCLRALVGRSYPPLAANASPLEYFEPLRSSGRLHAADA